MGKDGGRESMNLSSNSLNLSGFFGTLFGAIPAAHSAPEQCFLYSNSGPPLLGELEM